MLSSDGGEELFFDSVDRLSLDGSSVTEEGLDYRNSGYEIWLKEPQSVEERRHGFLSGMGLVEFGSRSNESNGLHRITDCSGTVSSSSDVCTNGEERSFVFCTRETRSEANSMVDELEQDQLGESHVACENETSGVSYSTQARENCGAEEHKSSDARKKKTKSWWKLLVNKRKQRRCTCIPQVAKSNSEAPKTNRMKVKHNKKSCMEFTGVYMRQEIQAHKGLIRTMKFSPDGQYVATGGEDGIVRIWRVTSVGASCKPFTSEGNSDRNLKERNSSFATKTKGYAPVVIPEKVFQIEESPLQEFYGHSSDVLDLAWSNSHCLLSASVDKTVRLWQVGLNHCLAVFHHSNYVTCIQFNPVNENYFISGSIDGKVRIWGVHEKRVVDWADVRDVISAICYQSDGKRFVVGSVTGACRFYEVSGNDLQLEAEIHMQGRKKNSGNRITSIQFCQERFRRVIITSEDSKIRIFDGVDIVRKFKGLPKSGSQMSASFTSTGRHIISVGEDCRVYVWDYDGLCTPSSKHLKSVTSCEYFFSEAVSVAVPWSGMATGQRYCSSGYQRSRVQAEDCASWRRDSERFSLGNWLFPDGPCTGSSATWPEEKLPLWDVAIAEDRYPDQQHQLQQQVINTNDRLALSEAWGTVIVTAGWDGKIRTFHNYGLPVRLK